MLKINKRKLLTSPSLALVSASLAVVSFVAWGTPTHPTPVRHHTPAMERTVDLPRCSDTSGRFDLNCWTQDKANGVFLNLDYGRYTYVLKTRDLIDNGK